MVKHLFTCAIYDIHTYSALTNSVCGSSVAFNCQYAIHTLSFCLSQGYHITLIVQGMGVEKYRF